LPNRRAPAWTFLHGLKSPLSSTALRALRGGGTPKSANKSAKSSGKKAAKPAAGGKRRAK
jgi:nicotinate-nucleotide adenylyltransferase